MNGDWRAWWAVTRPSAILMGIVVGAVLGIVGANGHPSLDQWWHILLSATLIALVTYSSDSWNMVLDVGEDFIHPKKMFRPIPSGQLPLLKVFSYAVLLAFTCFAVAVWFFSPLYVVLFILMAGSAFAYSAPPRFKSGILGNSLGITAPRSILGPAVALMGGVPQGSPFPLHLWESVLVLSVPLVVAAGELRNIGDIGPDRAVGVITISAALGPRAGWALGLAGFIAAPALAMLFGLTSVNPWLLMLWLTAGLAVVSYLRQWPMKWVHQVYHGNFILALGVFSSPWIILALDSALRL